MFTISVNVLTNFYSHSTTLAQNDKRIDGAFSISNGTLIQHLADPPAGSAIQIESSAKSRGIWRPANDNEKHIYGPVALRQDK